MVNYDPTTRPPDSKVGYAAVFRVDGRKEVERAFAASEPPAHDDWKPGSGTEPARAVKQAISLYRSRLARAFEPVTPIFKAREDGSLGALSNHLGDALGLGRGKSTKAVVTKPPKPDSGGKKKPRIDAEIEDLVQTSLVESDRDPEWRQQTIAFRVRHATGTTSTPIGLRLGLLRDDGGVDRPGTDEADAPQVLSCDAEGRNAKGEQMDSDRIVVSGDDAPVCTLVIEHPANRVLDVNLVAEGREESSNA